MSTTEGGRAVSTIVLLFYTIIVCGAYEVPDVTIEVSETGGFKASIPDDPHITLFVFQGNINREIKQTDVGVLSGEILQPKNGRWVYENPNLKLKLGDMINYYVVVTTMRTGYVKDDLHYIYTVSNETCKESVTKVRNVNQVCAGEIIFEDNFKTLNNDTWQIEHYIPIYSTDYPFVSYQRLASNPTVYVANGKLHISPKLQQSLRGFTQESLYSKSLNLFDGCTSIANECFKEPWGFNIIPPIVSGKITSKEFSFTYGTVYIKAKLPQGDWLYPEILLEPLLQKYGSNYHNSGLIKVAAARGNKILHGFDKDYSNKVLYGGLIMDSFCNKKLVQNKIMEGDKMWGDDFHIYQLIWTPDSITLTVDGTAWTRIEAGENGLHAEFPKNCKQIPHSLLAFGTKMAPFDELFYITLGVAAGGVAEFPDEITTINDLPKPWSNPSNKALLTFWQDQKSWYPTWTQPELIIDYIKVVAL